jgi:hypothetical protein
MRSDFAVMILTHGRANSIYTVKSLKFSGYTGKIIYVIDDEDKSADQYFKNYGDNVIVFNKKEVADNSDEGDNFNDRRTILHARNASFNIAKELGLKYWIQLDDDYIRFHYRLYFLNKALPILSLDTIFTAMIDFYKTIPAHSIAMAQGGDFIGGEENKYALNPTLKRKCMNSFLCSTDRPFKFIGRMNEDVNTYTNLGSRGILFFTIPFISLNQKETQSNSGGITEMYLDYGTYVKSFFTVMYAPSCTKVDLIGGVKSSQRLHHQIKWNNAVPKIISEKYKKAA